VISRVGKASEQLRRLRGIAFVEALLDVAQLVVLERTRGHPRPAYQFPYEKRSFLYQGGGGRARDSGPRALGTRC